MLLKNIKTGWQQILKNKFFSILNIGGVAIGIAVTALILFWVIDELSFDKFHKNIDEIYSVYEHQVYSDGQELFTGNTPFPLGAELKSKFAEVVNATTFMTMGNSSIKFNDLEFKEGPIVVVDKEFLNIFSFEIIEGDPNTLSSPDKIMITEEIAKLFFKEESPLGKVITIYGNFQLSVGAVIKCPEKQSTLNFKILVPIKVAESIGANLSSWNNNWPRTSILLAKGSNANLLNEKIKNICKNNGQDNTTLHLFPFKNERLYSISDKNNRIQYVYQFLAIAFIIVLIASINFVNSSTASSETRRSEVGIRKVLGANKINLTTQFFHEKGLMILFSLIISIFLILLLTPLFNELSGKTITFSLLQNKYLIGIFTFILLLILLLSVGYPALYISSFVPARVLQKQGKSKHGWISFRSSLVVVQFALSIILIICTIAVSSQLKYINNYNLGYERDNLVFLELNQKTSTKHEALSSKFRNIAGVVNLTKSDKLPFWGGNSSSGYNWQGKTPETNVLICRMEVDNNYFETMGISLADGKAFSQLYEKVINTDETPIREVILNQEAIRRMGMDEPIGKFFERGDDARASIVGVAEDFHFESLKNEMEPMLLTPLTEDPTIIILRIMPDNFAQTIQEIKDSWASVIPDAVCEFGFFNNRIQQMYNSELRISSLFKYFSFIAIFIACIGLFGLSVFAIERKKKEIGIRKVNGSRISQILTMLNKDFVKWVIIAFVIAVPVANFTMNKWLESFAYKTTLSWWIFAEAGVLALAIALLTVSWQSWRAATRNPVEALRYE